MSHALPSLAPATADPAALPASGWSCWILLGRRAVEAWIDDRAASMGAALAYYTLFSLAPLLLIVISVAGLVFGPEAARGEIEAQMRGLIGEAGAVSLQALLASVNRPTDGLVATLFGLGLMLVGATTVFAELQDTLDHIWRAPARPASGLWSLLRARVLSFGLILGVGFLLVVSLLLNTLLAVVQHWWAPGLGEAFAGVAGQCTSFTLMTLLFAMIYKIMPRARIAWTDVWIGALVTAGLLTAGRHGIGLLIATSGAAAGYGAAGSLVVLLLWVYYSAQIFLLGAEFTWVYAHALGSHRGTAAVRA